MARKRTFRVEVVEEESGWAGQLWNAHDVMVFQAHAKSIDAARRQAVEEFARFDSSTTPEVTIRYASGRVMRW